MRPQSYLEMTGTKRKVSQCHIHEKQRLQLYRCDSVKKNPYFWNHLRRIQKIRSASVDATFCALWCYSCSPHINKLRLSQFHWRTTVKQNLTTQFIFISFSLSFFSFLFWLFLHTYYRCTGLSFHLTTLNGTPMRDLAVEQTTTWQHTTRATDRHPCTTILASERPQAHALVRAATGIGSFLQTDILMAIILPFQKNNQKSDSRVKSITDFN